jgi:hypothetical protein
MQRNRLRLTIYLSAAGLAVAGGAVVAVAATNGTPRAAGGLTATFSKDSDWGTGYQARFTIRNTGSAKANGWQLTFGLPVTAKIASSWDAAVTKSGATTTAKNQTYNGSLAPGASTTFGFVVNGKGAPTSCTINGVRCVNAGPVPVPTSTTTRPAPPATTKPTTKPAPPPSTSNPPKPAPGAGGAVLVAPYVDMGVASNPGGATLAQLAAGAKMKSMTMAFVTSVGCKASWFNAFDPRSKQFSDQIAAIRAGGGDVKVSFGGATGIELAQACTDVKQLQAEYQAVVSAYNLTYIDMDIEGAAVADPTTIARRSTALAALQKANPGLKISLTLPVLPEGLTADGVNVVKAAKTAGVDLDLVNIMAMDYGRPTEDYGDLAKKAVTATKNQIKAVYGNSDAAAFKMVGVTPMLGKNDDQGTFSQDDARKLVTFANASHIGYMSYWEANRDKSACIGALFQCTNVQQTPFEFGKIFAGFTG